MCWDILSFVGIRELSWAPKKSDAHSESEQRPQKGRARKTQAVALNFHEIIGLCVGLGHF